MTFAASTGAGPAGARRGAREAEGRMPLRLAAGLGLGAAVLWLSLLVLLPLAAVVVKGTGEGWSGFWDALTTREALSALRLTVFSSISVAAVNAVIGTLIAWVLVRDSFWGKRVVEVVIDIPFALPTIVAGLVLLTLYGPHSPVGINWYATTKGIVLALLFVTLPFVVRTVQPVLLALDREVEQAAASLGASQFTTFRRIILPAILPAIAGGAALAFARAMGEYGSVVLISGGLQFKTEISSMYVYSQIENDELAAAAATATALLAISVVVMGLLDAVQRWAARRG
jgi:sulfate/thiosulfate transport system permease protein